MTYSGSGLVFVFDLFSSIQHNSEAIGWRQRQPANSEPIFLRPRAQLHSYINTLHYLLAFFVHLCIYAQQLHRELSETETHLC